MTYQAFEKKFKTNTAFDFYSIYAFTCLFLLFSSFMLIALVTGHFIKFSGSKEFHGFAFSFLFLLSLYGLFKIKRKFKLTLWQNNLTQKENAELLKFILSYFKVTPTLVDDCYAHFSYQNSWSLFWYDIHLFADNKLIAINVRDYRGGFIDLGKCNETKETILELLEQKASS